MSSYVGSTTTSQSVDAVGLVATTITARGCVLVIVIGLPEAEYRPDDQRDQ